MNNTPESDIRIAMWSGPRNISTAMMRAWGNRPDTHPIDEPFYAHYLAETNISHPGRDEVLENCEADWRKVLNHITGPIPGGKRLFYQKHMAHHLLPNMDRDWFPLLNHGFLIRDPAEMLLSLDVKLERFQVTETGLPQQVEIFEFVRRTTGSIPPVVDSRDVLNAPRAILEQLCTLFGVPFYEEMLSWRPGPRRTDGIWAKYWYDNVEASTGFRPYRPKGTTLPDHLHPIYEECRGYYDQLHQYRLRAN